MQGYTIYTVQRSTTKWGETYPNISINVCCVVITNGIRAILYKNALHGDKSYV